MRRISNKLKAVVISLVSLVIVAGGVLGGVLIYRNNNKGGNGGGNPGSGGISTDLTEAQRELASAINSSATLDVTEPEILDTSLFVDSSGNPLDMSKVTNIKDSYFSCGKDENNNDQVYFFAEDESGNATTINLLEHLQDKGVVPEDAYNFINLKITANNIAFSYRLSLENEIICKYNVISISDINNPKIVYEAITNYIDGSQYINDELVGDIAIQIDEFKIITMLVTVIDNSDRRYTIYISSNLNNLPADDEKLEYEYIGDSSPFDVYNSEIFIIETNTEFDIYWIDLGKINAYTLSKKDNVKYNFEHTTNFLFIEEKTQTLNSDKSVKDGTYYYKYSYKTLNLQTKLVSDFNLSDGYIKAIIKKFNDEYFYIYEQKVNIQNDLINEGKHTYYDQNFNAILSYIGSSKDSNIKFVNASRFITTDGIFEIKKDGSINLIYKFVDTDRNYSLRNEEFDKNNVYCIVYDSINAYYKLLDINGNEFINAGFTQIYAYDFGVAFGYSSEYYYVVDIYQKSMSELSDFDYDISYNSELFFNEGVYFARDLDDNLLLKKYDGTTIFNNISEFEVVDLDLLSINNNGNEYYYKISKRILDLEANSEELSKSSSLDDDYISSAYYDFPDENNMVVNMHVLDSDGASVWIRCDQIAGNGTWTYYWRVQYLNYKLPAVATISRGNDKWTNLGGWGAIDRVDPEDSRNEVFVYLDTGFPNIGHMAFWCSNRTNETKSSAGSYCYQAEFIVVGTGSYIFAKYSTSDGDLNVEAETNNGVWTGTTVFTFALYNSDKNDLKKDRKDKHVNVSSASCVDPTIYLIKGFQTPDGDGLDSNSGISGLTDSYKELPIYTNRSESVSVLSMPNGITLSNYQTSDVLNDTPIKSIIGGILVGYSKIYSDGSFSYSELYKYLNFDFSNNKILYYGNKDDNSSTSKYGFNNEYARLAESKDRAGQDSDFNYADNNAAEFKKLLVNCIYYNKKFYINPVYRLITYKVKVDLGYKFDSDKDTTWYYAKYGNSEDIAYHDTFSVSTPVRNGYTFVRWNISNMSSNCVHWYGKDTASLTAWYNTSKTEDTFNAYISGNSGAKYSKIYLKNLSSVQYNKNNTNDGDAGIVKMTAVWQANNYTLRFVFSDTHLMGKAGISVDHWYYGLTKPGDNYSNAKFQSSYRYLTFEVENGSSDIEIGNGSPKSGKDAVDDDKYAARYKDYTFTFKNANFSINDIDSWTLSDSTAVASILDPSNVRCVGTKGYTVVNYVLWNGEEFVSNTATMDLYEYFFGTNAESSGSDAANGGVVYIYALFERRDYNINLNTDYPFGVAGITKTTYKKGNNAPVEITNNGRISALDNISSIANTNLTASTTPITDFDGQFGEDPNGLKEYQTAKVSMMYMVETNAGSPTYQYYLNSSGTNYPSLYQAVDFKVTIKVLNSDAYKINKIKFTKIGKYSNSSFGTQDFTVNFDDMDAGDVVCSGYTNNSTTYNKIKVVSVQNTVNEYSITFIIENPGLATKSATDDTISETTALTSGVGGFTITTSVLPVVETMDKVYNITNTASDNTYLNIYKGFIQPFNKQDEKTNVYYADQTKEIKEKDDDYPNGYYNNSGIWKDSVELNYLQKYDSTYVFYRRYKILRSDTTGDSQTYTFNKYNTQFVAMEPLQNKIAMSTQYSGNDESSEKYALRSYLSTLVIGGNTYTIDLERANNYGQHSSGNYKTSYYSNITTSNSTTKINLISAYDTTYPDRGDTLNYYGDIYYIQQAYKFTVSSRTFTLYFALRDTDQHAMYFLFYNKPNNTSAVDIKFEFTKFDNSINIDNSLYNKGDVYSKNQTATGAFIDVDAGNASFGYEDETTTNKNQGAGLDNTGTTISNVTPWNTYRLSVIPKPGYLIHSITIKIYDDKNNDGTYKGYYSTLFSAKLATLNMNYFNSGNGNVYSLVTSEEQEDGDLNFISGLKYDVIYNPLDASLYSIAADKYIGFRFSQAESKKWLKDKINNAQTDVESFYFLLSGLYDNIDVSVKCISYLEFDFNYERSDLLHSDAPGESDIITEDAYKSVITAPGTIYNTNSLDRLTFAYATRNSSDNKIYWYNLKDYEQPSTNMLKYVSEGVSSVANKKYYRVIFLGYAGVFKDGIKIMATGFNHSAYFTNAQFYNTTLNYMRGKYSDNHLNPYYSGFYAGFNEAGTTDDNISVVDVEGRNISGGNLNNTDDITTESYITFIQINSLSNYFYVKQNDHTGGFNYFANLSGDNAINTTDRSGNGIVNDYVLHKNSSFEYNGMKFVLAMEVKTNTVKVTTNSYLYNQTYTNETEDGFSNTTGIKASDYVSGKNGFLGNFNEYSHNIYYDEDTNNIKHLRAIEDREYHNVLIYQLDHVNSSYSTPIYKSNSWFNDVVCSNIYLNRPANLGVSSLTKLNWQGMQGNSSKPIDNTYETYGLENSYIYNCIPGYYLQYIVIETVDFGSLLLDVNNIVDQYGNLMTYTIGSGTKKMSVSIFYDDAEDKKCFELKLHSANSDNYILNQESIAMLSNNFTVSFYSMAYQINISYDPLVDENYISAKSTLKVAQTGNSYSLTPYTDSSSIAKQTMYYDTLAVLDPYLAMDGYTFVGWANSTHYWEGSYGKPRFTNDTSGLNTWNSRSNWADWWTNSYNLFSFSKEPDTSPEKDYRETLLINTRTNMYYSAFYPKSSDSVRRNTTGYFITDTGFTNTGAPLENYNFWCTNVSAFVSSIGAKKTNPVNSSTFAFDCTMYGIWKANTYALELDINDGSVYQYNSDNEFNTLASYTQDYNAILNSYNQYLYNVNGTTNAVIGNLSGDSYTFNNDHSFSYKNNTWAGMYYNSTNAKVDLSTANHQLFLKKSHGIASATNTYYCYVTFDTNLWYIVDQEAITSASGLDGGLLAGFSYYDDLCQKGMLNTVSNKLEYVVDRYGYSWLGWFTKKVENTYYDANNITNTTTPHSNVSYFDGTGYLQGDYTDKLVFGSDYLSKNGANDIYTKENKTLNLAMLRKFECRTSESLYSEFVYVGQEDTKTNNESYPENGNKYIAFYYFGNLDSSTASTHYKKYYAPDYLNEAIALYDSSSQESIDSTKKSDNRGKTAYMTYFDTSLSYYSYKISGNEIVIYRDVYGSNYKVIDDDDDSYLGESHYYNYGIINYIPFKLPGYNYRQLTLFAGWEVNKYYFVLDYRDSESSTLTESIGSSAVTNKEAIEFEYAKDSVSTTLTDRLSGDISLRLSAYFDDLNMVNLFANLKPTRVGYDFVGWAFYTSTIDSEGKLVEGFRDSYTQTYLVSDKATNLYVLSKDSMTTTIGGELRPRMYTSNTLNTEHLNGTTIAYEPFGDVETKTTNAGGRDYFERYVYLYAIWKPQTYSINISLNIDTEELRNMYDDDSSYALAFYQDAIINAEPEASALDASTDNLYANYSGITTMYLKNVLADYNNDGTRNKVTNSMYSQVPANVVFSLTFDDSFDNAVYTLRTSGGTFNYYLKDLFAVSTGYYFNGWMRTHDGDSDTDSEVTTLIKSTLQSYFDNYGNLVSKVKTVQISSDTTTEIITLESINNNDWFEFKGAKYKADYYLDADAPKKLKYIHITGKDDNPNTLGIDLYLPIECTYDATGAITGGRFIFDGLTYDTTSTDQAELDKFTKLTESYNYVYVEYEVARLDDNYQAFVFEDATDVVGEEDQTLTNNIVVEISRPYLIGEISHTAYYYRTVASTETPIENFNVEFYGATLTFSRDGYALIGAKQDGLDIYYEPNTKVFTVNGVNYSCKVIDKLLDYTTVNGNFYNSNHKSAQDFVNITDPTNYSESSSDDINFYKNSSGEYDNYGIMYGDDGGVYLDSSGSSSNFGYISIKNEANSSELVKCYIYPETYSTTANDGSIISGYVLAVNIFEQKYYVRIYNYADGTYKLLANDETFLYYNTGAASVNNGIMPINQDSYIVRFDDNGNAYYINDSYYYDNDPDATTTSGHALKTRLNLRIALFRKPETFATSPNITSVAIAGESLDNHHIANFDLNLVMQDDVDYRTDNSAAKTNGKLYLMTGNPIIINNTENENVNGGLLNELITNEYTYDMYRFDYFPRTTRQFTLYADWDEQSPKDLSASISNTNNKPAKDTNIVYTDQTFVLLDYNVDFGDSLSNETTINGSDTTYESSYQTDSSTEYGDVIPDTNATEHERPYKGAENDTISFDYEYFDNLNIDLLPYYNGRYLSELKFSFYSLESENDGKSAKFINYRYEFIIDLSFDSTNRTLTFNKITINKYKDGATTTNAAHAEFVYDSDNDDFIITNDLDGNGTEYLENKDYNSVVMNQEALATKNDIKLSLLDKYGFSKYENGTLKELFKIFAYNDAEDRDVTNDADSQVVREDVYKEERKDFEASDFNKYDAEDNLITNNTDWPYNPNSLHYSNLGNAGFYYLFRQLYGADNTSAYAYNPFDTNGDGIPDYGEFDTNNNGRIDENDDLIPILYYDRRDVNMVSFDFDNILASIDIECKFAVQTFNVNFYNFMDDVGDRVDADTLEWEGDDGKSGFTDIVETSTKNYPGLNSTDATDDSKIKTIPIDTATEASSDKINVPYGFFIYGNYYKSDLVGQRPVDGDYNVLAEKRISSQFTDQRFSGYEYIYLNGYYPSYGKNITSPTSRLEANVSYGGSFDTMSESYKGKVDVDDNILTIPEVYTVDNYYDQCAPVLGNLTTFGSKSLRLNLSFFSFKAWYEVNYEDDADNAKVYFDEYSKADEEAYINRDINLYAYYYAINTPTNIEFYTWNDSTSEYTKYSRNSEEYTLNSNSVTSPFDVDDDTKKLVPASGASEYTDISGNAKIEIYQQFGVDATAFRLQNITVNEIDAANSTHLELLNNILKTYWNYKDTYLVLKDNYGNYLKFEQDGRGGGSFTLNGVVVDLYKETDNQGVTTYYINNDKSKTLEQDIKVTNEFVGADLYFRYEYSAGLYRYYKLEKTTATTGVESYYRYKTQINGRTYYMMQKNLSTIGNPTALYDSNGNKFNNADVNIIVCINNYYVYYNYEYIKIDYKAYSDENNSTYYMPYGRENTVELLDVYNSETGVVDERVTFRFNLEDLTLYRDIAFTKRADFSHTIYTPVNENFDGVCRINENHPDGEALTWEMGDIVIKRIPTPNIGFWYNDSHYDFMGYVIIDDEVMNTLKKSDSEDEGVVDATGGELYKTFEKYINATFLNYDPAYINIIKLALGDEILKYEFDDIIKSLLIAESYTYDEEGYISSVMVNIPCTFTLKNLNMIEGWKASWNDDEAYLTEVELSLVYKFNFEIINDQTTINESLKAIPIYSPSVMEFNKEGIEINANYNEFTLNNKLTMNYFEVENTKTFVYNNTEKPQLIYYAVMKPEAYNQFKNASNKEYMLSYLISQYKEDTIRVYNNGIGSGASTFLGGGLSVGYIVAYYLDKETKSVVRVSDNALMIFVNVLYAIVNYDGSEVYRQSKV